MKSLELNAYGVSEMSRQEMVETDGGFIALIALAVWAICAAVAVTLGVGASQEAKAEVATQESADSKTESKE